MKEEWDQATWDQFEIDRAKEHQRFHNEQLPFIRHSESSRLAARQLTGKAKTLRQKVFDFLRDYGPATDKQIQEALSMEGSTQRPRRIELVERGLVVEMGKVMQPNGRAAIAWGVPPDEAA
tara:strand:+ start:722 stop:1084 length:363 start_codon:yes stop_codon:yes gene_type:complete